MEKLMQIRNIFNKTIELNRRHQINVLLLNKQFYFD